MKGVCDVCRLVKGDRTEKDVQYCSLCDSNICDTHRGQYHWRALAALKGAVQHMGAR